MAKSGIVSGSGSNNALISLVLPAAIITHTLGSLAFDVLRNKGANGILVIDTGDGKVALHEYSAQKQTAARALIPLTEKGEIKLVPVDRAKASSEHELYMFPNPAVNNAALRKFETGIAQQDGDFQDVVDEQPEFWNDFLESFRPSLPSFNGSTLINTIADFAKEHSKQALIIIDQQSGETRVKFMDDVSAVHNVATAQLAGSVAEAVFTVTPEAEDGAIARSIYGI